MLRPLKRYLARRYPELAGIYHSYRFAQGMRRYGPRLTPYGFKLKGNLAMQDGTFEPDETGLVQKYLRPADIFVDVGANIGFFSCLACSLNKKTIAIEPLAQNLDYLYENLAVNGYNNVEVYPLGLSAQPGIGVLYGGSTGASLVQHWAGASKTLRRNIALSTLDILLGERFNGRKLLIKIDVEGAEYDVLRGAVKALTMSPSPEWLVEICFTENQPKGINPNFSDIFKLFWSHGYQAHSVGAGARIVSPEDVGAWVRTRKRGFGYVSYLFNKKETISSENN